MVQMPPSPTLNRTARLAQRAHDSAGKPEEQEVTDALREAMRHMLRRLRTCPGR